jgi:hypothetical protein
MAALPERNRKIMAALPDDRIIAYLPVEGSD